MRRIRRHNVARPAFTVIGVLAATGALAGFVTAGSLPRAWRATATVAFVRSVSSDRCTFAAARTLSETALAPLVLQDAYYREELDYTPVEEIVGRIRANGAIRELRMGEREGFAVEFTDPDRYAALDVTRILIEEMTRNAGEATRVVSPVTATLSGPGPAYCTLIGMSAGIALGLSLTALSIVTWRNT